MINKLGIMKKGESMEESGICFRDARLFCKARHRKGLLSIRVSLTHRQTWIG